jgi:DNA-binding transcriptional regulator PaaX
VRLECRQLTQTQVRRRVLEVLDDNWLGVPQLKERIGVGETTLRVVLTTLLEEGALDVRRERPYRYSLTFLGKLELNYIRSALVTVSSTS